MAFQFRRLTDAYFAQSRVGTYPRLRGWEFLWDWSWSVASRSWRALAAPRNRRTTALHLGFYLANWGMLRGSSGLLNVNLDFFEALVVELFEGRKLAVSTWDLRLDDFADERMSDRACAGFDSMLDVLTSFGSEHVSWTDTLKSKVLMGVWGQCPALDRFVVRGMRAYGNEEPESPIRCTGQLSSPLLVDLAELRRRKRWRLGGYHTRGGHEYPPGKVVDMAFFQYGLDLNAPVQL